MHPSAFGTYMASAENALKTHFGLNIQNAAVLVVDDDEDVLQAARLLLKTHFATVELCTQPLQIPLILQENNFDVVLLDMNFSKGKSSGAEGLRWLRIIKEKYPETKVVMLTAYGDVQLAMQAMREGAADFVLKPWENDKLVSTLTNALNLNKTAPGVETQISTSAFEGIIGRSTAMQQVFNLIEKVAPTDANVLILGENGTGKELVAKAIHERSARCNNTFIGIDVGALPPTLFESELFGHTKGAFTDAHDNRKGRFEMANGGTLFLDEIGNIPVWLQAKLLSALQTRTITPVGSGIAIPVDIRLISATNQPIGQMVNEGKFRQDLHYRLNTIEIHLPPLRQRTGDVELLCEYYLGIYSQKYKKGDLKISAAAMKKLQNYNWPGNVRELQHTLERAVILCDNNVLDEKDLSLDASSKKAVGEGLVLEDFNIENAEKQLILKALERADGNITKAAKKLGLTRAALYRRLEKYGF